MTLQDELNQKKKELNDYKMKNELLINDVNIKNNFNEKKNDNQNNIRQIEEELRDNKIEIALKYRENEDLKTQIKKISEEKINKERMIEELNEDNNSHLSKTNKTRC